MRKAVIVLCATALITGLAWAQDRLLNSETDYFVSTVDGRTVACGMDLRLVFLDNTYRQGSMSAISASLTWAENRGNLGVLLKVVGVDFDGLMQPNLFKVQKAYLAVKGTAAPLQMPLQCENSLNFCGSYWLPLSALIYGMLPKDQVSIGFNRQQGGIDIVFPISGTVDKAMDAGRYFAFHGCIKELTGRLSAAQ